jgi:hypothetical protein
LVDEANKIPERSFKFCDREFTEPELRQMGMDGVLFLGGVPSTDETHSTIVQTDDVQAIRPLTEHLPRVMIIDLETAVVGGNHKCNVLTITAIINIIIH